MGWGYYTQYNRVERAEGAEGEPGLQFQLQAITRKRETAQENLDGARARLEEKKAELAAEKAKALRERMLLQNAEILHAEEQKHKELAVSWKDGTPKTNTLTVDLSTKGQEDYTREKDEAQKKNDERIKEITRKINEIVTEGEKIKSKAAEEYDNLNKNKAGLKNILSDYERKVGELITRETPTGLAPVGRILTSDPEHDLAVINLGTRHGVKPGMRFEVRQIRHSNHVVHKGNLEVKTAGPEVSTCTILVKEIRLPRCPVCSYTGSQPEELYCPKCTAPGTSQGVQRLNDTPKIIEVGKDLTDPIIKGDLVYNPLFTPGKKTRYAVSGTPLLERTAYGIKAIKDTIAFYNNVVDERLTAQTDVLIALRSSEDLRRAKELGIKIIYGFELFRYLEQ
jgi:hypothetical protein